MPADLPIAEQMPAPACVWRKSGLVAASLAACLFALSLWGAWVASRQTEYPPIHDVLSYTSKAENVWKQLREGHFTGLLAVEQTIRPFGTALMGYPLGYSEDFRAFYWRTVAIPACLCVLAALVAAMAAGASWKDPSAWLLACLGGMLPMWWAFDPAKSGQIITSWGMIDGMQASTAALATALLLFGWRGNAATPTFAGFFLSAFTLLLKPVGVFLMAAQAMAAFAFWIWSFRVQAPSQWRRFAWGAVIGIVWCAAVGAWCYFSPYFSEANQEMGRQALDQLKTVYGRNLANKLLGENLPKLCIKGVGLVSIVLCAACVFRYPKTVRRHGWASALPLAATLVSALLLAVLYRGTHFITARYFLPLLAITWIFWSPLLWFLLRDSRIARLLILLNVAVLATSVWFPGIARESHQITGYATFTNAMAHATAKLARESVAASPRFGTEPVIYVLPGVRKFTPYMVAHQLVGTGGWKENVLWKYAPRFWEKHSPMIHPHEIATADFLITGSPDPRASEGNLNYTPENAVLISLDSSWGRALAPILAEGNGVAVRRIADRNALEKALDAKLAEQHFLQPDESGPVQTNPGGKSLAKFTSGDELLVANAGWADGKLRITTAWSGSRTRRDHLAMNFALLDANGTPVHWLMGSLLPPPCGEDGKQYKRTIVDDLDCGNFRNRTASVGVRVFDRSRRSAMRIETPEFPAGAEMVRLPITAHANWQP